MAERLIDATLVIRALQDEEFYGADMEYPILLLQNAQTIDAKPIVYGKWEVVSTEKDKWVNKCTACGAYLKRGYKQTNYCPNCGAKMFGKEGE